VEAPVAHKARKEENGELGKVPEGKQNTKDGICPIEARLNVKGSVKL
jgi:hypothetical protein